jgi:hypothetical protein
MGCTNLKAIKIPDNVKYIGKLAFNACSTLKTITIPAKVETIGNEAFSECSSLKSVSSYNTTPPACGTDCFEDKVYGKDTLYVPTGTKELYANANIWREFLNIEEVKVADNVKGIESNTIKIHADGRNIIIDNAGNLKDVISIYDINGRLVDTVNMKNGNIIVPVDNAGLYLVKTKSTTQKILIK